MNKQHLLRGAALVSALVLASCASFFNGPGAEVDPEVAYPITVGPHMETLSIPYGNGAASAEHWGVRQRLQCFGQRLHHRVGAVARGGDRLCRSPGGAGRAARPHRHRPASQGGAVQLSYVGYGASSPPCGNWPSNVALTEANLPTANFGCATQHNLAAMIADPRDLVDAAAHDAARHRAPHDGHRQVAPRRTDRGAEDAGAIRSGCGRYAALNQEHAEMADEPQETQETGAFGAAAHERPVPRISIQAFCEFPDTGAALSRWSPTGAWPRPMSRCSSAAWNRRWSISTSIRRRTS